MILKASRPVWICFLAMATIGAWLGNSGPAQAQRTFKVDGSRKSYAIDRYPDGMIGKKRRVVVLVHGVDGLVSDSGPQIESFAEELEEQGFLVFVPHYFEDDRDIPRDARLEVYTARLGRTRDYLPVVRAAVDSALRDPDADPDRLGLVGFSLGGGLVLAHAESAPDDAVDAVVDFYGYVDAPGLDILANAKSLPPTVIFHNENDVPVPVRQSKDLIDAMGTDVTHSHHFFDESNPPLHHFFRPDGNADKKSRQLAIEWLKAHL